MSNIERWTSRKFWAMVVWEAIMVWLLYSGKLPSEAFVSITWLLLGGYFVSNLLENVEFQKVGGITLLMNGKGTNSHGPAGGKA